MPALTFKPTENVTLPVMVQFEGVPTDVPGGVSSLAVHSLYVLRDGLPIDLSSTGVSFASVSGAGNYLATFNRAALTTEAGLPFVQQSGDVFNFSESAEIAPGAFVFGAPQQALIDLELSEVLDSLTEQIDTLNGGTQPPPPVVNPIPSGSGIAQIKGTPSVELVGERICENVIEVGPGVNSLPITVNDCNGIPVQYVCVSITDDKLGKNKLASGKTDMLGHVSIDLQGPLPNELFIWRSKAGYRFKNPINIETTSI